MCAARHSNPATSVLPNPSSPGDWSTPNLVDLLRVLVKNRAEVESVIYGTWAGRLLYRVKHLLNRNTRSQ